MVQSEGSSRRRVTNWVFTAWPALWASTRGKKRKAARARSPMWSPAFCVSKPSPAPRRAVENRDFNGVDVDEDVVNPAGIDGGKQMLGGGEQNALFHEARGIADASDVVPLRFDREIVQVNAAKHDTGVGWGRH